ncbi:MAG: hypothetical protein U0531_18025 [Dehalococcoidia bacterium]
MTEAEPAPRGSRLRRLLPPWWTALFPIVVTVGVGAWRAASAEGDRLAAFFAGLLWPGGAAFVLVALMVWLGWVLDID